MLPTLLASCGCRERPADIVLITVDTLRADRLGAYGCESCRTPNIDRLAEAGLRFDNAVTPLPRTTPAVASLLSGLEPHHHGSREVGRPVIDGTPMLPALLAKRGYITIGISANPSASVAQGIAAGFEHFVKPAELGSELAESVTKRALSLVRNQARGRPIFLWLLYVDPHAPYGPPPYWRDQPPAPECRRLQKSMGPRGRTGAEVFGNHDGIASAALDSCRELYDAEIAYTDFYVGQLLDGLELAGRLAEAVVVLTSDHGENLGEKGLYFEHGPSLHDASLRVPMIVVGPGVPPGVDREIVRLQDLAPTLLRLAGVPAKKWPPMDGVDFGDRLRRPITTAPGIGPFAMAESGSHLHAGFSTHLYSGRADGRHCYHEARYALCGRGGEPFTLFDTVLDPRLQRALAEPPPSVLDRLLRARERWPPEEARERGARTARFKLVEYPVLDGEYRAELYDLWNDPDEAIDLSDRHPRVTEMLARALHEWGEETRVPAAAGARGQEEIDALRALGYID